MSVTKTLATSVVLVGFALALNVGAPTAVAAGPNLQVTAQALVGQCGNIESGDLVLVSGSPREIELLENIAVCVRKVGAFPLITIESDRLARRMFDEVPGKFDTQAHDFALKLAGIVNATISVESTDDPALMAGVAPERVAARAKANQAMMDTMLKRNVRQVSLGNGFYPTAATAKQYGMPQEELASIFWKAVETDYSKLQNTGETVQQVLAAGKEIQLTHPNGTDLKFKIEGRPVFVSDGVISEEDVSKGGAACQVWLPAGEVYTTPVPGTAEGKVVVDRLHFQGQEITGLTLNFKAGKLTDMSAKSGLEPLKALYDAADGNRDAFGFIDIGINENMKLPKDSKLLTWMPAGMIAIGVGNNTWGGGTNVSSFSLSGFIPGSTMKVDGKPFVENGALKF